MAYATKLEIGAAIDGYEFIQKRAIELAKDYTDNFELGWLNEESIDVEADGITGEINFETEHSYCNCCSNDIYYHTLPISYLWDDNWIDREKEKRAEALRQREKRITEEKAKQDKEREEQRYKRYLSMKEEYEGK